MECDQCNSLMTAQDGVWVCPSCMNVVTGEELGDDTILEEGLMLSDVLAQMKELRD